MSSLPHIEHTVTKPMGDLCSAEMDTVRVTYQGETHAVQAARGFRFGRGASNDLDIDRRNALLHRRFGRLALRDGIWWLDNEGSRLSIALNDRDSATTTVLAPGGSTAVTFSRASVRFSAGSGNYEILIDLPGHRPDNPAGSSSEGDMTDQRTMDQSKLPLAGDQQLLVLALAEQKLRNPHEAVSLPTNKAIARRFGWSKKAFDGKLGRVCEKFARWGVPGLVGESAEPAKERRRILVEQAIELNIVTRADLERLDDYPK